MFPRIDREILIQLYLTRKEIETQNSWFFQGHSGRDEPRTQVRRKVIQTVIGGIHREGKKCFLKDHAN